MELSRAEELFIESVQELKDYADPLGVDLLVENNVLTHGTFQECGEDVLLMASGQQICDLMARLPIGIGLLMDVAHLKVSARTLGFDQGEAMDQVAPYVTGYHLSDNDGLSDSNSAVTEDSWFWSHLSADVAFSTLEITPRDGTDLREQVELAHRLWVGGSPA